MAEAFIPVDLLNPGQVFACIGLTEAANALLGGAEGAFDWRKPSQTRFRIMTSGTRCPVLEVLRFLHRAEARGIVPEGAEAGQQWKSSWGTLESRPVADGYPIPAPSTPATVVCILTDGERSVAIDHWGDSSSRTSRDNVKFWAGSGGYPGVALARDALDLMRSRILEASSDPFALGVPQSSSFRLDWRRDYIPLDAGFSLNQHAHIVTVGFPIVELLAAIGLGHARPRRPEARNKLEYTYSALGSSGTCTSYPLPLLRAGLGGACFPFPMRHFRMFLNWPGKEGQARAITAVIEETR